MAISDSRSRTKRGAAAAESDTARMLLLERLRAGCGPGVRQRPRRGQIIDIAEASARTIWLVESGCVLVQQRLRTDVRQVLAVLLAGDALDAAWTASVPGLELMATTETQLVRTLAPAPADATTDRERAAETARVELLHRLLACLAQHITCLGRLAGEERIAVFLTGLVRRHTVPEALARPPTLPLSRRDVADCLALNPDTVSRILSQLRRQRVLSQPSRNEIVIKNWDALVRMSPF